MEDTPRYGFLFMQQITIILNILYRRDLLGSILPRVDAYEVAVRVIMGLHFFCCSMSKIHKQRYKVIEA